MCPLSLFLSQALSIKEDRLYIRLDDNSSPTEGEQLFILAYQSALSRLRENIKVEMQKLPKGLGLTFAKHAFSTTK